MYTKKSGNFDCGYSPKTVNSFERMDPVGGNSFSCVLFFIQNKMFVQIKLTNLFLLLVSVKYYRDHDGFLFKKSGENARTIYLNCLHDCISGARYHKDTGEIEHFGAHSHEKPDDHEFFRIAFEEFLKKEIRKSENDGISVLNLYKRAKNANKGMWLPMNHQRQFLGKLRRIRLYERTEKPKSLSQKNCANSVSILRKTVDVATSPMHQSMILQRVVYSTNDTQDSVQQNAQKTFNSSNTVSVTSPQNYTPAQISSADANTFSALPSPIHSENVTPSNTSLILQRIAYSPDNNCPQITPRQNYTPAQEILSIDILTPPIQFRNRTPTSQGIIIRCDYSADKSSSDSVIQPVRSFNIRVVSNGDATPFIETSVGRLSAPKTTNKRKKTQTKKLEPEFCRARIQTRATTAKIKKSANYMFIKAATTTKTRRSLFNSTENDRIQTTVNQTTPSHADSPDFTSPIQIRDNAINSQHSATVNKIL